MTGKPVIAFTHEEAHALLREAVAAGDTRYHVRQLENLMKKGHTRQEAVGSNTTVSNLQ
jgi:hypothetical protein